MLVTICYPVSILNHLRNIYSIITVTRSIISLIVACFLRFCTIFNLCKSEEADDRLVDDDIERFVTPPPLFRHSSTPSHVLNDGRRRLPIIIGGEESPVLSVQSQHSGVTPVTGQSGSSLYSPDSALNAGFRLSAHSTDSGMEEENK